MIDRRTAGLRSPAPSANRVHALRPPAVIGDLSSPAGDIELKFVAPTSRTAAALRWLHLACRSDPEFPDSTIFTVYYDTLALESLGEKRNSDYLKTKVRLRWYRVGSRCTDTAFLEVKTRQGSRRRKRRVTLPYRPDWPTRGSLDVPSLRYVTRRLRSLGLPTTGHHRPVLLVRYRRRRFLDPRTGLRVCLDTDIRVPAAARAVGVAPHPLPLPLTVFEIKGQSDLVPEPLRLLTVLGFRKTSFSKYLACYDHVRHPLG